MPEAADASKRSPVAGPAIMSAVEIKYFSDILCVWAYISQARIDAIKEKFGDTVRIEQRFCSVFGDTANSGTVLGENPIRANYTGQPVFGPGTHTADEWFNPAAFATPAAYTFGNAGRNSIYGPSLQTLDFALERTFQLGEKANFQLRGEAFNGLNQVNLGTPNRFVNTPQFGTITMAMTPGREIQLSARFSF